MHHEKRKQLIIDYLNEKNFAKFGDLQEILDVTEMTVWRDLKELEASGTIRRIRGGAELIHPKNFDNIMHAKRIALNAEKKRIIGKKAAALIQDKDIIFISSGSTNEFIKEYITAHDVRIMTNSGIIFRQYVNDPNFDVTLIGGKLDRKSTSFIGVLANDIVGSMSFDKTFLGTNGITLQACSASNDEEGVLYRIALNQAQEKYVLCDSTKFNKDAFYKFYSCSTLTAVISDDGNIENRDEFLKVVKIL